MEHASASEKNVLLSQGYAVLKKVGQGSYAKVFVCESKNPETPAHYKKLACKIIDTASAHREFVYKFFPRELEILMKMKHPNIIHVYAIFKRGPKFFILMRLAENKDLLDYVITQGEVPEDRARFWVFQIASALNYIHSRDIVHRDLKCENILLTNNYNVKLCDFGFAKIMLREEDGEVEPSTTFCGSLAYTAPEVLELKPYNPKMADMWSLGVIIFVLLSKSMPYQEKTAKGMLVKQKRRLQFVGRTWDLVSMQSKNTICKLLEIEPKIRWSADYLLRSPWIMMDSRLIDLSMEELKNRGAPRKTSIPIPSEKRRLIAQMKINAARQGQRTSFSQRNSVVFFKDAAVSKYLSSMDFFTVTSDNKAEHQSQDVA